MDLNVKEAKVTRDMFSVISNQSDIIYPDFKEDRGEWVKFGPGNDFPNDMLKMFNKSGIHNAIIESKVRMMLGNGIVQDEDEPTEPNKTYTKTEAFIDAPNPDESLDDLYAKLSLDYEIHGLAYVEVLWSRDHKSIAQINHIDTTKIRWGKMNKNNKIDTFFYSRDFSNYRKDNYKPISVPIFNPDKKEARQILPIVRYSPGQDYYTLPDYFGGLKWIHIDTEIANFHYNNLRNGMVPTLFFGFPVGDKSDAERKEISDKLKEKYEGTNNTGKMLLAFYDAEGDKKPEVQVLEMSNADKQFNLLNKTSLQQILVAHKVVNENLVGISTPGKLGSANELLSSYELYFNTIVKYEQSKVLKNIEKIFTINGLNDIKISNSKPFEFTFTENVLKEVLTSDELRDLVGYLPLEEDKDTAQEEITGQPEVTEQQNNNTNNE